MHDIHDCLIIGGGPAGLSAAVYMGRFLRDTVVLDEGRGRSTFGQVNDNYLGFPNGISVTELRERGEQQAMRFGVRFERLAVQTMRREEKVFVAETEQGEFRGKTVILCTGVTDIWPDFPGALELVGKTMFWCIVCDGFRTVNKRVVLIGRDDDAATTACQFLTYTNDITFVAPQGVDCSDQNIRDMKSNGISILEGVPAHYEGVPEKLEALCLQDGRRLECDLIFSLLGAKPNNQLALDLGIECSPHGYVLVDEEGYTNVPGVFCAGDLSRMHTHQVIAAAHEGAEAAQTANYYMYSVHQKTDRRAPDIAHLPGGP